MALATRCPHCATTFRVAHDQLKLRAGLVRCGACKQIFNGVENLLGPDVLAVNRPGTASTPTPTTAAPVPPPVKPAQASAGRHASGSGMPAAAGKAAPSSLILSPPTTAFPPTALSSDRKPADKDEDPLTRMTLMDFTAFEESNGLPGRPHSDALNEEAHATSDAETPDEIEQAIEDLQRKPWRGEKKPASIEDKESHAGNKADEADEPDFVKHARRRQQTSKTMKWVYGAGSFLLLLALAGQLTYAFRDQLAQRLPQTAPLLQQACSQLGCRIGFPTPVHALAIESSELQAVPSQANAFVLRALLANRYDTTVAWPYLELTLIDQNEKPVARRSFSPAEYLTSREQVQTGFGAQSEQAVAVHFVLQDVAASGFSVYLFYP
jgi:predicted Zn finger-like uncharacterized protein